jgi:hypothetical protein
MMPKASLMLGFLRSSIKDGQWVGRATKSDILVEIQSKLCLVPVGDQDIPQWTVSKFGKFSCLDTWNAIRNKHNQVGL